MACYNSLEEYQQAYDLSYKQILSLESLELDNFHYETAEFHHLVACLGLGKYQEIIDKVDGRSKYSMRYTFILLISKYKLNINDYLEMYNLLISSNLSSLLRELLTNINELIIHEKLEMIELLSVPKFGFSNTMMNIVKKCLDKNKY